jgi:hypothetical protein
LNHGAPDLVSGGKCKERKKNDQCCAPALYTIPSEFVILEHVKPSI